MTDSTDSALKSHAPVILFDGECGFCSRIVVFVFERDSVGRFRFAPLQSDFAQRILAAAGLPTDDLTTLVLYDGARIWIRSTAALRIASGLRWPWRLARVLMLVPRPLRDLAYDIVARNRHRMPFSPQACILPASLEGRLVSNG